MTHDYYEHHAATYFDATVHAALHDLHAAFVAALPAGAHILDAGCGSGRDSLAFLQHGYRVTAFDASAALVTLAEAWVRQQSADSRHFAITTRRFQQVAEQATYDGIWACASLLHVPAAELPDCLTRLWQALKPGGVLYCSFKHGHGERTDELGRHFTDADEEQLTRWVSGLSAVRETRLWQSADQTGREVVWVNGLVHKAITPANKLITGGQHPLLPELCRAINRAQEIDIAVAFVKSTGLKLLLPDLSQALAREGHPARIRFLASDYLDITDPPALRSLILLQEQGADIRIFATQGSSFHLKAYLFAGGHAEATRWGKAFIGSSNISQQALQVGLEWNYRVDYPDDAGFLEAQNRFEELWRHDQVAPLTDAWITAYEQRRKPPAQALEPGSDEQLPTPKPTPVQLEALAALDDTRRQGFQRGLVVLATGLGKTWLAAFDAQQCAARRVLFVAHREEILQQAAETFLRIRPRASIGFYQGQQRDREVEVLCASVQTLSRAAHLRDFAPDHFDYVVIDEFHHAVAATYRRILRHFAPRFLLGLTATPDRTDCADILSLCDDNLVFIQNLFEGITRSLLAPFHYYGIFDESVDYQGIPWRNGRFDPEELAHRLATERRAAHALRLWRLHRQHRTLAFCVSTRHADFMAAWFQQQGVRAASVHGQSDLSRGEALGLLKDGQLEIVFSVDLFNEGMDLPTIDTVMLLRPTDSKVLFLQQIGRGLRKVEGKDHLVVLDFVGNHQGFLHKPQALLGRTMNFGDLANFAWSVQEGRLELPPGCHINYDLELIDFLKALGKQSQISAFDQLKSTLGRRPTLTEFFQFGGPVQTVRTQYGSWFEFLASNDELAPEETTPIRKYFAPLRAIEVQAMVKSYTMILLEAFLELDGWRNPPTLATLSDRSWEVLHRRGFQTDLPDQFQGVDASATTAWHRYWLDNPINALTGGNRNQDGLFVVTNAQRFRARFTMAEEDVDPLSDWVQEIVDYKLAQYKQRSAAKGGGAVVPFARSPGLSNATEVPFFPELRIACGHFKTGRSDTVKTVRLPGMSSLEPLTHFIAPASGDSMNGGKHPIRNGDLLLMEAITPDRAGSITGKTVAIERQDTSGDDQYLLRVVNKNANGQYVLKAQNPAYEDIVMGEVEAQNFRTFARFKSVVDPWLLRLGEAFQREDIPPLFGVEFNPGNWHSGHISLPEQDAIVLLVTINKQGKTTNHQYIDYWIDDHQFHWQSQSTTTPDSKKGKDIIEHSRRGLTIHLFVRESKLANGKAAPFIYFGPVAYRSHQGSAPMSVVFELIYR